MVICDWDELYNIRLPGIRRYCRGAQINRGGRSSLWLKNCDKFWVGYSSRDDPRSEIRARCWQPPASTISLLKVSNVMSPVRPWGAPNCTSWSALRFTVTLPPGRLATSFDFFCHLQLHLSPNFMSLIFMMRILAFTNPKVWISHHVVHDIWDTSWNRGLRSLQISQYALE